MKRRKIVVIVVTLLCLTGLGFVSNMVSEAASERAALRASFSFFSPELKRPFRFSDRRSDIPFVTGRLREIGETFEMVSESEFRRNPFPNVRISRATTICPFLHKVEFGALSGPRGGEGGDAYVLNFFGCAVCVKKVFHWLS